MDEMIQHFTRMFRLNSVTFDWLLRKLTPYIERNAHLQYNVKNTATIPPKIRLAATLRWLAGGSVHDICFAFGIGIGLFYSENGIFGGTMEAIDQVLIIEFPLNDVAHLEAISEGFSRYTHGRLGGCVMAMDGWICRTRKPYTSETPNKMAYRNRKNLCCLVFFAGCDHRGKFLMFSTKCSGSTNDCGVGVYFGMSVCVQSG